MNKAKKKQRMIRMIVGVVIAVLVVATGFLGYQFKTLSQVTEDLTEELNANTQTVYVTTRSVAAGEELKEGDNVALQTIRSGLENGFYMQADELGSYALVDMQEGTPVLYAMTTSIGFDKDTRSYEIAVANLQTTQVQGDIVDVRIMFPNGEDYIVLPHRLISSLNMESSVFTTTANEEEILRMSSAIIDAYTTAGAYIYTTRYISGEQEDATPTYPVRSETLDLINSDPNVLTKAIETLNLSARLSLESRLSGLTEDQLEAVVAGWGIADTAKSSTASSTGNTGEAATEDAQAEGDTTNTTNAATDATSTNNTSGNDRENMQQLTDRVNKTED